MKPNKKRGSTRGTQQLRILTLSTAAVLHTNNVNTYIPMLYRCIILYYGVYQQHSAIIVRSVASVNICYTPVPGNSPTFSTLRTNVQNSTLLFSGTPAPCVRQTFLARRPKLSRVSRQRRLSRQTSLKSTIVDRRTGLSAFDSAREAQEYDGAMRTPPWSLLFSSAASTILVLSAVLRLGLLLCPGLLCCCGGCRVVWYGGMISSAK